MFSLPQVRRSGFEGVTEVPFRSVDADRTKTDTTMRVYSFDVENRFHRLDSALKQTELPWTTMQI